MLVGHLGMSGQLLVAPVSSPDQPHLHIRLSFGDDGSELRFVDQRTFGGVLVDDLVPCADVPGDTVPARISHIARDPLDDSFDAGALIARIRNRSTTIKRALLDQSLVSGIGNIYADESCGEPGCTERAGRPRCPGRDCAAALRRPDHPGRGRRSRGHVIRRPLRQCEWTKRIFLSNARSLRPGGTALSSVRNARCAGSRS